MAETLWTVGTLLNWTAQHFATKAVESPRLDAEVLLSHVLKCRRIELYTRSAETPGDEVRSRFRTLIERRLTGCPVAYLVGSKEFFLIRFEVTPAVLIPRPSTETLVVAAAERIRTQENPWVLDLGTGSGCIAIGLALQSKLARFVALDSSAHALEVARRNAATHQVSDRIDFRHGDLFVPVAGETFSAIVSNPPYIPSAEMESLAKDVRDHEPRAALDGGADGLDVIRRIISEAPAHLKPGGWLLFEFGAGQDAAVSKLIEQSVDMKMDKVIRDGDGIPRVLTAQRR